MVSGGRFSVSFARLSITRASSRLPDQSNKPLIGNPVLRKPEHPLMIDFVEGNRHAAPKIRTFRRG
jgi:hypothetical protein